MHKKTLNEWHLIKSQLRFGFSIRSPIEQMPVLTAGVEEEDLNT